MADFGSTLTSGIQDISALLPILGTEQCENHIGSALEGGYLYAAATVISIFGSLGIVKAGIAVLIASMSIPKIKWSGARSLKNAGFKLPGSVAPKMGIDLSKESTSPGSQPRPDSKRYMAETSMLENLEEKHIDDPERLSIQYTCFGWNVGLVVTTFIVALISGTPYIHLLYKDLPEGVHLDARWVFPLLRTIGSCLAAVSIQFIIQLRVITTMKKRIIFMVMNQVLIDDLKSNGVQNPESALQRQDEFIWNSNLPAEESLSSLEHYLRSSVCAKNPPTPSLSHKTDEDGSNVDDKDGPNVDDNDGSNVDDKDGSNVDDKDGSNVDDEDGFDLDVSNRDGSNVSDKDESNVPEDQPDVSISMLSFDPSALNVPEDQPDVFIPMLSFDPSALNVPEDQPDVSIPMLSFDPSALDKLDKLYQQHFRTPIRDRFFLISSWLLLLLGIPAIIVGYIGCFTIVSNSKKPSGPFIWLGLEIALMVVRVFLWAWNPKHDENTQVTMQLRLSEHPPLVTTEKDVESISPWTGQNVLTLVPERQFLEHITPYTGPLEQFNAPENTVLFYTMSGDREWGKICLYLTISDLSKRTALTVHHDGKNMIYEDAEITPDPDTGELQAKLQSRITADHPRRANHVILHNNLNEYYTSLLHALHPARTKSNPPTKSTKLRTILTCIHAILTRSRPQDAQDGPGNLPPTALLPWKWNLSSQDSSHQDSSPSNNSHSLVIPSIPSLSEYDFLYLQRGFEHDLKQMLIDNWGEWIVRGVEAMRTDSRYDWHHALADPTSEKAKWELTELDMQVAREWVSWELTLLEMTIELERHLDQQMEGCIKKVADKRGNVKEKEWLSSEWTIGQRKRLQRERERAKTRMEEARKDGAERAEKEGRQWERRGPWEVGREFYYVNEFWERGQTFIDEKWTVVIESGASPIEGSAAELERLVDKYKEAKWMDDEEERRFAFVEQLRPRFERWTSQRKEERREMEATIERIKQAEFNELKQAYNYPGARLTLATRIYSRFIHLDQIYDDQSRAFVAKVSSATVYDVIGCDIDMIRDVIAKSTTRSVINVPDDLVQHLDIPDNRLLYIQSRSKKPFFRNLNQWWKQQKTNSWTCFLSPDSCYYPYYTRRSSGTIAYIMIFIQNPTRVRLGLLHFIQKQDKVSVSIQEQGKVLRHIDTSEIPRQLRLQDFDLDVLGRGQHHLELVVEGGYQYALRGILVEFFDDKNPSTHPSDDKDKAREGSMVEAESERTNDSWSHMQDGDAGLVEGLDNEVTNVA